MSASASGFGATVGRLLKRGAAALAGMALDAAVGSLDLGKRCVAAVSQSAGARYVAVGALAIALTGAAAWALRARSQRVVERLDARDAGGRARIGVVDGAEEDFGFDYGNAVRIPANSPDGSPPRL
jgi:hypothetical protein